MPAEVESPNQAMVPVCEAILSSRGGLDSGGKLLDFGCGVGRHVREFRASGYDTVGVDRPYEGLAEALEELPDDGAHLYLSTVDGQFPFDTATFDFCYSTSVFEHVMSYDEALVEIARVLKPGAWTLHIFPSRWRPIEPHMFTPFGGRFQQKPLIALWAKLGIRNSFQKDLNANEVATRNLEYSQVGINYPTKREISDSFHRHFNEVHFVEKEFVDATRGVSWVSRRLAPSMSIPGMESIYRGFHTRVVLARK